MTVTENIGWASLGSDIVESSVTRKLQVQSRNPYPDQCHDLRLLSGQHFCCQAPRGGTQAIYMGVGTTKDVYRQGVNVSLLPCFASLLHALR